MKPNQSQDNQHMKLKDNEQQSHQYQKKVQQEHQKMMANQHQNDPNVVFTTNNLNSYNPMVSTYQVQSSFNIVSTTHITRTHAEESRQQINSKLMNMHGSPNRARDRNLFDKISTQDAQSLPLIKGVCIDLLSIFSVNFK